MENLKDTVDLMSSDDYKERFKAEYYQTKIRYEKLKNLCNKIEAANIMNTEEPKHDCTFELLRGQKNLMEEYLHCLEIRAVIEKVEL